MADLPSQGWSVALVALAAVLWATIVPTAAEYQPQAIQLYSCADNPPQDIQIRFLTPTSALLNWSEGGSNDDPQDVVAFAYAPSNASLGSFVAWSEEPQVRRVPTSQKNITLDGLVPSTRYAFAYRLECAGYESRGTEEDWHAATWSTFVTPDPPGHQAPIIGLAALMLVLGLASVTWRGS